MNTFEILASELPAIILTLKLSLITCVFLFFIGTPISLFLAFNKKKYKTFLESLITLPLVLPSTVIGFYLLIFFNPETILGKIFITLTGQQLAFSFNGLVFASIIYSLPFWVQPLQNAIDQIDKKTIFTCINMGATKISIFFEVLLPLCRKGFITSFILSFAHTIGEFGIILMVGGNIEGKTRVLSISIYDNVEQLSYQNAHVLSMFLIGFSLLVLFSLYFINNRNLVGLK